MTIPLALDGRWTSAAWAVEGVGLVWVGLRQQRTLPRISGLALQLLGAIAFIKGWGLTGYATTGHQNMFLGVGFIALSGWACGALLNAYRTNEQKTLIGLLTVWGWLWWVGAGLTAIHEFLPADSVVHFGLLFVALTSGLLPYVADKLKWQSLANLTQLLLPVMVMAGLSDSTRTHPFANVGAISWFTAFAIYGGLLSTAKMPKGGLLRAPLLWLAAAIGSLEWRYGLSSYVDEAKVWRDLGWGVSPAGVVAVTLYWPRLKVLPAALRQQQPRTWLWLGCLPLLIWLTAWFVYASLNYSGDAAPLPYIPFVNPLDMALMAILLLWVLWRRQVTESSSALQHYLPGMLGLLGFILLNGVLLRSLHYWLGTPFEWTAIFDYPQVQMGFTFLWGISAFMLMLLAHKTAQRHLWMLGAGLMGLVVAKIFMLDLAQHGSIERIISFMGAGIILLVMGYFAPLPPVITQAEQDKP